MASHTLAPFPEELLAAKKQIREQARSYGLDFFNVIFEMCDYEQMNQIAAYGGFPQRYPHWRFGSEYEGLRKRHHYGLGRIYEMVINNDPCYAYLQESNQLVDQKLVIAHVYGHSDFFKNNLWFSQTNRKMMDEMANHSTRVRKHIEKHGYETVEKWLDVCLSIEDLIDSHSMFLRRGPDDQAVEEPHREEMEVTRYKSKEYLDRWVNPPAALAAEAKKMREAKARQRHTTPSRPSRDVLKYLLEHARLEDWQADCLSIVREEAYYFAPQGMTKVMNEGWACVVGDSLVMTDLGMLRMSRIVDQKLPLRVWDGQEWRRVQEWARFEARETVRLRTERGFELEGSTTHQVLLVDGTWKRLDEIGEGDRLRLAMGANLWPRKAVRIEREVLRQLAVEDASVAVAQASRAEGGNGARAAATAAAVAVEGSQWQAELSAISFPQTVDESLATILGFLVADARDKGVAVGISVSEEVEAARFSQLVSDVFGIRPRRVQNHGRWGVNLEWQEMRDLLTDLGICPVDDLAHCDVPEVVLRSPREVMVAYLRAIFDCDGDAGKKGIRLASVSEPLSRTLQLVLANFSILAKRNQHGELWYLHISGLSAVLFARKIGFGSPHKKEELDQYLQQQKWSADEWPDDAVVAVERGRADVYDVSVEQTHRYSACGLINHNSYWHSTLMTRHFVEAKDVIDYADHHSGTVHMPPGNFNPYKVGIELFRDIEDRWNKGKFGKDYEEADDLGAKKRWDKGLGIGREKIFEVRRVYNDVNFIDEFMTPEFIEKHKFYQYDRDPHTGQLRIISRDPVRIKQTLLYQLTNMGRPFIYAVDGNYANRGELYLVHRHNGLDIEIKYAVETLKNVHKIWQRPVHLQARIDDDMILFSYDGTQPKQQTIHDDLPKPAHQIG